MPPIVVDGEHDLPLEEALLLDSVSDTAELREAFEAGRPVVIRADTPEGVVAALARPEVSCVLVPAGKRELLDLDLVGLTYGE